MAYVFQAKPTTAHLVGRVASQNTKRLSDILLVVDVRDKDGNPQPDYLVPRRDVYPLPDNHVAFSTSSILSQALPNGQPDLTSIGPMFVWVRKKESFDTSNFFDFAHGFISEVVAVPSAWIAGQPNVGELIVHYEQHTYWVNGDYGFVRVARGLDDSPEYGYFARVVIT